MGYFTQHIIRIIPEQDATLSNYRRVAAAICKEVDDFYNFCIHDGIMDDSNWNAKDGTKWYLDEKIKPISKHVPDLTIRLDYIGETYSFEKSAGRIITLKNGSVVSKEKINPDEFYEIYGYVPNCYELSDETGEMKHQGDETKITDLYRHDSHDDDFDEDEFDEDFDDDDFDDDDFDDNDDLE